MDPVTGLAGVPLPYHFSSQVAGLHKFELPYPNSNPSPCGDRIVHTHTTHWLDLSNPPPISFFHSLSDSQFHDRHHRVSFHFFSKILKSWSVPRPDVGPGFYFFVVDHAVSDHTGLNTKSVFSSTCEEFCLFRCDKFKSKT